MFVKNLPYEIGSEELYDVFGKYGAIRQVRLGNEQTTRGTAFIVFEEVQDAKAALDRLSGFSLSGRYLVVLPYSADKAIKDDLAARKSRLEELKTSHGIA